MPEAEIPSPSPSPPIPQPTDSDSALSKEDLLEERKNLVKLVSALNDELLVLKKNQETHSTETFRPSDIPNVRRDDHNVRIGEKDMLIRDEVKKTVSLTMHDPPDVVLDSVLSGNKDYKLRQTVLQHISANEVLVQWSLKVDQNKSCMLLLRLTVARRSNEEAIVRVESIEEADLGDISSPHIGSPHIGLHNEQVRLHLR
ncbi:hypothetical protein TrVE_jg2398 [Triparma verrucosa]|uniref:Uncharacterized protein n=1 Tax=Triparma verrucosa TaxID=1606542 RepID=A0A9W6Z808_9STRA|nr:hypothetical protein TrVE_jg2398 [Triparma verrucosa]